MGWFSGKADGVAYEPTRSGMQPMMRNGKLVLLSELSKDQRKYSGQDGAVARASRSERKARTVWGSKQDFKKSKGK